MWTGANLASSARQRRAGLELGAAGIWTGWEAAVELGMAPSASELLGTCVARPRAELGWRGSSKGWAYEPRLGSGEENEMRMRGNGRQIYIVPNVKLGRGPRISRSHPDSVRRIDGELHAPKPTDIDALLELRSREDDDRRKSHDNVSRRRNATGRHEASTEADRRPSVVGLDHRACDGRRTPPVATGGAEATVYSGTRPSCLWRTAAISGSHWWSYGFDLLSFPIYSDFFLLFINHKGRFVVVDGYEAYYGDCVATVTGLDADRLGYFDIEDEMKKLGYENWGRICYKHRTTREFKDITDDAGVMDCLGQMQENKRYRPCGVAVCQQKNESRNRVSEVAEVDQANDTSEKLICAYKMVVK
ncbi:transcription termination/antitermination protein NusA [Striga asiatica]|uniref:Transcription termination/antitermination protein NusA n=1 Tax=Striga asiatica TaxID=4170 RepID=A0A5A7QF61_STRAF|nr:transcription termination/antitermination protein NusA [Striga asiatica]